MGVRIGSLVLYPHAMVLPFALAFFLVISWRMLLKAADGRRNRALCILLCSAGFGVAGAAILGLAGNGVNRETIANLELHFCSFGGYWGALIGASLAASALRTPILAVLDALVPGIVAGGAVARIGCLFAGCCRGIPFSTPFWGIIQPLYWWPALDMAALMAVLAGIIYLRARQSANHSVCGSVTALFLVAYSLPRFLLEFVRDAQHILYPFTYGHVMAGVQMIAGLGLVLWLRTQRARTGHPGLDA
ncbi:MAG TPA: prolipoprotein diacylglyceryl transferase [Candidatus Hydrogenedentes bacterium]|nr:prolipoprotein diacylglyceryl transferase [Candidatus Hydrogenedentota bacterium]HQH54269.1 prolipoprotein diacylglyceryl transferase [Candidatus Hydrogenedentota bacterium]